MSKFKVGDVVIRTDHPLSGSNQMIKQGEKYTITSTSGAYIRFFGAGSGWDEVGFKLADESVTDEDLAAENSRLYEEQRRVTKLLKERGYVKQWRAPHRNQHSWKDSVVCDLPDEVRFIKTVTTTKVL